MSDSKPKQPDEVTKATALPRAKVVARRKSFSLAWILPLLALVLAAWLGWRAWVLRGTEIIVVFDRAHGLDAGDEVRFRGMAIGEVEDVVLSDDLSTTQIILRLHEQPNRFARQGTRFWIVRPRIGPSGVSGLDTIMGPRYIAVEPGAEAAQPREHFIGLEDAPIVASIEPDDLEIVLEAESRGSMQQGAPVFFRGVQIGTILSVGLASDGIAIEARAHIENAFAGLLRQNTRFWDSGGAHIELGITGFTVDVDSLSSLMVGGVTAATPPDGEAGEPVRTGHRFRVASEPEEGWLAWQPALPIGSELLPEGAMIPSMERARLTWEQGIFQRNKARSGWVLQTFEGILGPANLLQVDDEARDDSSRLEIAGRAIRVSNRVLWEGNGLARIEGEISARFWPQDRMRRPTEPEDCVIFTANTTDPMPLAAVRLSAVDGSWQIDRAMSFEPSWHGAAVISRNDGALVGLLLVEDGVGSVRLLTETAGDE